MICLIKLDLDEVVGDDLQLMVVDGELDDCSARRIDHANPASLPGCEIERGHAGTTRAWMAIDEKIRSEWRAWVVLHGTKKTCHGFGAVHVVVVANHYRAYHQVISCGCKPRLSDCEPKSESYSSFLGLASVSSPHTSALLVSVRDNTYL